MTRFSHVTLVAVALTVAACGTTLAETQKKPAEPVEQTRSTTPQAAQLTVPEFRGLTILIQNSLIALNHANLTKNYSVFRDLAAPGFQKLNSTKQLATIFEDLRVRNVNLSPIVLYQPKIVGEPLIDKQGFLRMAGFYETRPLQVNFNLVFQPTAAVWRLFEISVWTTAAP